ncbi:hypothetical protein BGP_4354 [Beggiatoa sp. PS]|nr:hypothetical protein BGP_4354 [Beggiatoa sp. PS]
MIPHLSGVRDDARNNIHGLKPDRFPKPVRFAPFKRKLFVAVSLMWINQIEMRVNYVIPSNKNHQSNLNFF